MALGQFYNRPSSDEVTLKNVGKWIMCTYILWELCSGQNPSLIFVAETVG